jgi:phage tail sheath protein FI
MPPYNTPGVYVEEISTLPPSVAEVSTAIPAFFGYTERGPAIARVTTLLEYEEIFGGPKPASFTVTVDAGQVTGVTRTTTTEFLLYYAVSHYFKNGGGACYIVSIGSYGASLAKAHFVAGLGLLEKEDEPTLVVLTDAVNLTAAADYHELCQSALDHCHKLGDRFSIFDVRDGDISDFRNNTGTKYLAYGAAYHPYLQTSLSYAYAENGVTIQPPQAPWSKDLTANSIRVSFTGPDGTTPTVTIVIDSNATTLTFAVSNRALTITAKAATTSDDVVTAWTAWKKVPNDPNGFEVVKAGTGAATLSAGGVDLVGGNKLDALKSTNTALYNQIKARLTSERVVLPPSAAVAGVYASVDRDRGVWKAPANVSVAAVIGPVTKITDDIQDGLNLDSTAGKSINAIRAFTGKGTLVWGARTLAGNDNEWRYVPVRRLFIMIEESARKATSFAVFEPNDMTTWLKVRGMIESFLYGLWERGALAGPTPAAAYYVNVGLGKTMTTQDILEGRMIVEIGVAAVRPAEFIILRFSHKLQQA